MDIENEIRELKRRVGDLEGAVNTLAGKMSSVQSQLTAATQSDDKRFANSEQLMQRIIQKVTLINTQVWALRDDLPGMLETAVGKSSTRRQQDGSA